uniref:Guanylate cyclase n=1 Tax=Syphacia muris TaxID=451379 RepID=A0A0N5AS03_9BILA
MSLNIASKNPKRRLTKRIGWHHNRRICLRKWPKNVESDFLSEAQFLEKHEAEVKIGLVMPRNETVMGITFYNTAPAIEIALEKRRSSRKIGNLTFTISYRGSGTTGLEGTTSSLELINIDKIDVLFGPLCNPAALIIGPALVYFDIPNFLWGPAPTSDYDDNENYPLSSTTVPNTYGRSRAIISMLEEFGWRDIAFVYTTSKSDIDCVYYAQEIEAYFLLLLCFNTKLLNDLLSNSAIADSQTQITLVLKARLDESSFDQTLESIRVRSRVILTCFDKPAEARIFMKNIYKKGMVNKDYVYITSDFRDFTVVKEPIIISGSEFTDGDEDVSQLQGIFKTDAHKEFEKEFLERARLPPFNCFNCTEVSPFAYFLHDAVFLYMELLERALQEDPEAYKSGQKIMAYCNITMEGLTGEIVMSDKCTREPTFFFTGYNRKGEEQLYATIQVRLPNVVRNHRFQTSDSFNRHYINEAATVWEVRGGVRPLNEPICGFENNRCVSYAMWYGIAGGAIGLIILIGLIIAAFSWRTKEVEKAELMKLWQVEYQSLTEPSVMLAKIVVDITGMFGRVPIIVIVRSHFQKKKAESHRSLQSGFESTTSTTLDAALHTSSYKAYLYRNEIVLAKQHTPLHKLTKNHINTEVRVFGKANGFFLQMRQFDHENINKFIGLSIDGPMYLSIWKFNSRGTLRKSQQKFDFQDVIQAKMSTVDAFFKFCLMRDLLHGIHAIHKQPFLGFHGRLTSSCCLVNERWQVRVADFGLAKMGFNEEKSKMDLLWTAPELLRGNEVGSKEGDVYSFAIICSEIATGQTAWNDLNDENAAEDIIYHVRRGRTPLTRPSLEQTDEFTPVVLHLIRDCWAEHPEDRPTTEAIKQLLRSVKLSKKQNLMDHVFALMENYAANLKREVEEKTKEAIEEKKRADLLLYKILPPQVADKLKLGQSVEPESYDEVTIFFSDVVAFTSLAAKCTPLQVVTLLNDLYTMFDNIIDEHDVYKVETIGDGYLCASGVPRRNGHDHGRQIANMALSILKNIKIFKIPHLPSEKVNVRIGIHSGPCVAGIVGLAMPRYCLFGDAVNTASRMESNGKPGRIQLSNDANYLLTKVIGGFKTESRGEILIKGKGVMETFWLLSGNEQTEDSEPEANTAASQPPNSPANAASPNLSPSPSLPSNPQPTPSETQNPQSPTTVPPTTTSNPATENPQQKSLYTEYLQAK